MPGYRGHLAGAAVLYALCVTIFGLYTHNLFDLMIWLTCTLAGGLFPDIDTKSMGQRIFYSCFFLIFCLLWFCHQWQVLAAVSLGSLLPLCVNHRGLMHNAWFIALLGFGAASWTATLQPAFASTLWYSGLFFVLGAYSHLYLDLGIKRMFRWRF